MVDIYDNLENYEDVNAVDELKNENQELKLKLKEYEVSMAKLQKHILQDFDKLSGEFKKLEVNYSSLLKTARTEIERKSDMINNLNKEKDILVLNSLRNNSNKRNLSYNFKLEKKLNIKDKSAENNIDVPEKSVNKDNVATSDSIRKDQRQNSEESLSNLYLEKVNKHLIVEDKACTSLDKLNSYRQDGKAFKENIKDAKRYTPETVLDSRVKALQEGRKSMPVLRIPPKFSSDEEFEEMYLSEKNNIKNLPKYTEFNEGGRVDKSNCKILYRPREEERFLSDHEFHKNKTNRYSDNDVWHRNNRRREKRFVRHQKHYSPDHSKPNRIDYRDYPESHKYRHDYTKHKVLESPSPTHRGNFDPKFNYDRDYTSDYRRQSNHVSERSHGKFKSQPDHVEPQQKRFKASYKNYKDDYKQGRVKHIEPITNPPKHGSLGFSCQSPDFTHVDHSATVAEIPLENVSRNDIPHDPRMASGKYNPDSEMRFCSKNGKNIHLQTVSWDATKVEVPKALMLKPQKCSDNMIKAINMDTENLESNLSLESGEVLDSETSEVPAGHDIMAIKHVESSKKNQDLEKNLSNWTKNVSILNKSVKPIDQHKDIDNKVKSWVHGISERSKREKSTDKTKCLENEERCSLQDVPKLSHNVKCTDKNKDEKDVKIWAQNILEPGKSDKSDRNKNIQKDNSRVVGNLTKPNKNDKSTDQKKDVEEEVRNLPISTNITPEIPQRQGSVNYKIPKKTQYTSTANEIETLKTEKTSIIKPMSRNYKEEKIFKKQNQGEESPKKCEPRENKVLSNKEIIEKDLHLSDDAADVDDSTALKKESVKPKKEKKNKVHKKITKPKLDVVQASEDQVYKATSKDIKSKFSDLFGDSSSLILPEDLEIASDCMQAQSAEKFFEDAVDMSVEDMLKAQAKSSNDTTSDASEGHSQKKVQKSDKNEKQTVNVEPANLSTVMDSPEFLTMPNIKKNNVNEKITNADEIKTVIISTGMQPVIVEPLKSPSKCFVSNDNIINNNKHGQNAPIPVLTTSTPERELTNVYKDQTLIDNHESQNKSAISVCTKDLDKTTESQHEVPDVRIFVKRRKRFLKKPSL